MEIESAYLIDTELLINIIVATLAGFFSRWILLKVDYRQYPSYPNGYFIHLIVGFIAAASGAIVIPALLANNFTAVTFLFLAIQQFREVRKMERDSLIALDKNEFFPRGEAYIDGISKGFESRNYIALIISFITIAILLLIPDTINLYIRIISALAAAALVHYAIAKFTKGYSLDEIADVKEGMISFQGNNLYIDNINVTNIGLDFAKNTILEKGIGIIMVPKGINESVQLNNIGQRKAILHECSRLLGLERYIEDKRDFNTGVIAILIVPIRKEVDSLLHIIRNVPLLEIVRKQALPIKEGDNK